MAGNYGDGAPKGKRSITDLPVIPKRQRAQNGDVGQSSQKQLVKKAPLADAVLRNKTNNRVKVYEDFHCRLILPDEEKFLVMQIAVFNNKYALFTRWGQLGEDGQWDAKRLQNEKEAVKAFKKKFREKTDNGWNTRDKFVPHPGKYCLQESM
nr:protein mono-ADP-ribosyltransferase PARP3-like [Cherax quadricarinatus]